MALIDPLLRTTRTPIWVHPLLWRLDHLDTFRITISIAADQPKKEQTLAACTSDTEKHLSRGSIGSRDLRYILQDINLLEIHLAAFITRTINTFQKTIKPKLFRYYSQIQRPKPPSPLFTFSDYAMQIHPELVVRTKKGFPFLLYNCPERITSLRHDFPNTRAGCDVEWMLKHTVGLLDFKFEIIDPYNVAALLALAQEQQGLFCRFNQTTPDMLKVYLISPHPTLAAVYFYTAKFPLCYLDALRDPYLKVTKTASITRELVELPIPPAAGQTIITSGRFLDILGQVLEEATGNERLLSKSNGCNEGNLARPKAVSKASWH